MRVGLLVALALWGCADVEAPVVVPEPCACDDGDPCTEDRCDATTGACFAVPRDPANACTIDRHCDDGLRCTLDACAVDDCGLMRCRREIVSGCEPCDDRLACADGDPCTVETCEADLCEHTLIAGCEPRCDPGEPAVLLGRVEPSGDCAGCPCVTGLSLATDEGGSYPLETLGSATCEVPACGEPMRCRPLDLGRLYTVWGAHDGARVTVEGFCLVTPEGLAAGDYDGRIAWHDGGEATFRFTVWPDLSRGSIADPTCDDCPVTLPLQDLDIDLREGWGRRLLLHVDLASGERLPAEALLLPGARGYRGLVRVDAARWAGDVELRLRP